MKEVSITELRSEKVALREASQAIIESAKAEARAITDDERKAINENEVRMHELNLEIDRKMEENRTNNKPNEVKKMENKKFSLRKAILAEVNHRGQEGVEAEVLERGAQMSRSWETTGNMQVPISTRAIATAAGGATAGVVDTENQDLLLPLENYLVAAQVGAQIRTGLVGNIQFPTINSAQVAWKTENAVATDGNGGFGTAVTFSPKRLTAYIDISKQLLIQENQDVDGIIQNLLTQAIAQKLENTMFSASAAVSNTSPAGLFNTITPASAAAMSWAGVVALETGIDTGNALMGNLAYILRPELIGKGKTTVKDSSGAGGFIINQGDEATLNGYKVLRTNNIAYTAAAGQTAANYGAIFGNFADLFIGHWGALDITVDQYTQATYGAIRLVVNSYWDFGPLRTASFKTALFTI